MKPYTKKRSSQKKRAVIGVAILIALTALGFGASKIVMNRQANKDATGASDNTSQEDINYAPATEEEKQQTDDHKEELAEQQGQTSAPSDTRENATPVITDAGQYDSHVEVRSFIPEIVEANGKCTMTFKQGTLQLVRTTDVLPSATTTICEPPKIPATEFPNTGKWVLTVSYDSPSSRGTSDPWEVEVK